MRTNIVEVIVGTKKVVTAETIWQYDYGQVLKFVDLELPESYEVHFSNTINGSAFVMTGNDDGVQIPDELIAAGKTVHAYLYLHTGEDDGETVIDGPEI